MSESDVLIIGSGIAGLSLAIKLHRARPDLRIALVCKDGEMQSNTRYAQGGISVVSDLMRDSFEKHIEDTLKAGDGLCDHATVQNVVRSAPDCLAELLQIGVAFDRDRDGHLDLAKEGGHSASRVVHVKDMTGLEILKSLLVKVSSLPSVTLLPFHSAVDLLISRSESDDAADDVCTGAIIYDMNGGKLDTHHAAVTVLATGGIGQVYRTTTNPLVATGDGIAMAHRAGASVQNMEFIQFHPTALFTSETNGSTFLITEALRGYGAVLRNGAGERFMSRYDAQGELACRDVVARAIASEIAQSGFPCVYLDCTHLEPKALKHLYPTIFQHCLDAEIDITKQYIPVAPAAHYLCGGIRVDRDARTSIPNLYALGECACTGLHGANRLASNSLLEAMSFAETCSRSVLHALDNATGHLDVTVALDCHLAVTHDTALCEMRKTIQQQMTALAGVVRTTAGLKQLKDCLDKLDAELASLYPSASVSGELMELRNIMACSKLIVEQSMARRVNRGTFYNKDFDMMVDLG